MRVYLYDYVYKMRLFLSLPERKTMLFFNAFFGAFGLRLGVRI